MHLEEYHARQQANAAQNQAARAMSVRRHLKRALELLDRETNPAACKEIEAALRELA